MSRNISKNSLGVKVLNEHDFNSMNEQEVDKLLKNGESELQPQSDVVNEITPWSKAINRVLVGLALSTLTLNFLWLNYILPAIGIVLMLLGIRCLRNENFGFKACWIISIIRIFYFFPALILNATIWQKYIYQLPAITALQYVNIALIFVLLFCLRSGFRSVQIKSKSTENISGISALIVWYVILCVLGLIQYSGWIIAIIILIAYVYIIRSLCGLSSELNKSGNGIQIAPIKISDKNLTRIIFGVLVLGIVSGYLFFGKYPMSWEKINVAKQSKYEDLRVSLLDMGFPETVLNDLTEEDISNCHGAIRVVTDMEDYAVNDGREVTQEYGNVTHVSTVYDVMELRITSVAVELSGEQEQWKIFHYFDWVIDPGFFGTEVIQLWPTYRGVDRGWSKNGNFSGHVLYDDGEQTYAAPYYSLEYETYEKENTFFGNQVSTDAFAAFSFPSGKENYRGYISYEILEDSDGYIIDSWLNYVHQRSRLQYPVQTALDSRTTSSMFSSNRVFFMIQDALQFDPNDKDAKPF